MPGHLRNLLMLTLTNILKRTSAATTAKSTMMRLKKIREDVSAAEANEAKTRKEAAK